MMDARRQVYRTRSMAKLESAEHHESGRRLKSETAFALDLCATDRLRLDDNWVLSRADTVNPNRAAGDMQTLRENNAVTGRSL